MSLPDHVVRALCGPRTPAEAVGTACALKRLHLLYQAPMGSAPCMLSGTSVAGQRVLSYRSGTRSFMEAGTGSSHLCVTSPWRGTRHAGATPKLCNGGYIEEPSHPSPACQWGSKIAPPYNSCVLVREQSRGLPRNKAQTFTDAKRTPVPLSGAAVCRAMRRQAVSTMGESLRAH